MTSPLVHCTKGRGSPEVVQVMEWTEFSMARLSAGMGEKLGGTIEGEGGGEG